MRLPSTKVSLAVRRAEEGVHSQLEACTVALTCLISSPTTAIITASTALTTLTATQMGTDETTITVAAVSTSAKSFAFGGRCIAFERIWSGIW